MRTAIYIICAALILWLLVVVFTKSSKQNTAANIEKAIAVSDKQNSKKNLAEIKKEIQLIVQESIEEEIQKEIEKEIEQSVNANNSSE